MTAGGIPFSPHLQTFQDQHLIANAYIIAPCSSSYCITVALALYDLFSSIRCPLRSVAIPFQCKSVKLFISGVSTPAHGSLAMLVR